MPRCSSPVTYGRGGGGEGSLPLSYNTYIYIIVNPVACRILSSTYGIQNACKYNICDAKLINQQ
jgi:hypothetical protein